LFLSFSLHFHLSSFLPLRETMCSTCYASCAVEHMLVTSLPVPNGCGVKHRTGKINRNRSCAQLNISIVMTMSRVRGSVTNNNEFWIGWLDLLTLLWTISLLIKTNTALPLLLTSQITRACYPFPGNWFITQKLSLLITMKYSCHFFFNHIGLPTLQNSTQFSNSISSLCTPLLNCPKRFSVCYKPSARTTWKTPFFYCCLGVYSYVAYHWAQTAQKTTRSTILPHFMYSLPLEHVYRAVV
jgi:hypothetical protein